MRHLNSVGRGLIMEYTAAYQTRSLSCCNTAVSVGRIVANGNSEVAKSANDFLHLSRLRVHQPGHDLFLVVWAGDFIRPKSLALFQDHATIGSIETDSLNKCCKAKATTRAKYALTAV